MGKGKRFELDTKNNINENTKPWVKAHRPDFSGNSVGEVADVMVVWEARRYDDQRPSGHPERHVAYAELKKRQGEGGKRSVVMSGSSDGQSGLEELQELQRESPSWATTVVGVKFPRRQMFVLHANALEHWLRRDKCGFGAAHIDRSFDLTGGGVDACERHGARLTRADNISMVMPSKDDWPTQTKGLPPWKELALTVGLEGYDFDE